MEKKTIVISNQMNLPCGDFFTEVIKNVAETGIDKIAVIGLSKDKIPKLYLWKLQPADIVACELALRQVGMDIYAQDAVSDALEKAYNQGMKELDEMLERDDEDEDDDDYEDDTL